MLQIADGCGHLAAILKADEHGQTPFHLAVQNGREDTMKAIISATECDELVARTLFARNKSGCTPLEIAIDMTEGIGETVILFAIDNGIECKTLM